ncbi:conserved hypothetical protein [Acidithiobacillus caldus SM-1]|uniref:Uncharacterized protein n=1 Tax=Acidithiobacillus caldus (strain SM-1) TaxID=990288 RepID=F9ZSF3_ACICS|nr:conserved hypothetical protein [Acidithiobacillus caldus SM-1]QER43931.1 hypothetical protein F0726_00851 [Acidithiobacillus caldus]
MFGLLCICFVQDGTLTLRTGGLPFAQAFHFTQAWTKMAQGSLTVTDRRHG